jgi:hypothetical protein
VSDLAIDVHEVSSRTVFFIELKGRHIEKALEQLASTIVAVRGCVLRKVPKLRLRAIIASSGWSAPKMVARQWTDFRKSTGITPELVTRKNLDLRDMLAGGA